MLVAEKTLLKVSRMEEIYRKLIFEPVAVLEAEFFETAEYFSAPPKEAFWRPASDGMRWGGDSKTAWFRACYKVPGELWNQPLFLHAPAVGCEALFYVNGEERGMFNAAGFRNQRGTHEQCQFYTPGDEAVEFMFHVEAYAGHRVIGSNPFDTERTANVYPDPNDQRVGGLFVTVRNDAVRDFVFDLAVLNRLSESLGADSFRKGRIDRVLETVFAIVPQKPEEAEPADWMPALAEARRIMAAELASCNSGSAPFAGLIGHSHMDTAWLWPVRETVRKCARTWSNALELMREYPEYLFTQSSLVHNDLIRKTHPALHERIMRMVQAGRWELIGNAWVEPDCNLCSGESLIRQFLRGFRFLDRYAGGRRSCAFFLPDSFGYPASLPQILRGCGMRYFLTTKLSWNETSTFPYDTFLWRGIDGSEVLTHFNEIHCTPDPRTLREKLGRGPHDYRSTENYIQHKDLNSMRLITYGFGDGGGGPGYEMLEYARRCRDLEGCPRSAHITVEHFMEKLEASLKEPPHYTGELYLELHRGTLTGRSAMKRANRKLELALRDLEILIWLTGSDPERYRERIDEFYDVLLLNQFHDILPGTSIPCVHEQAERELCDCLEQIRPVLRELGGGDGGDRFVTVWNTLNWDRRGHIELERFSTGCVRGEGGWIGQPARRIDGTEITVIGGVTLPSLGAVTLDRGSAKPFSPGAVFRYEPSEKLLETPDFRLRFHDSGAIVSLIDLSSGRELVREGGLPLNTLLCGEDVPLNNDNWDIDADLRLKLQPEERTAEFRVVSDGPLEFRLECDRPVGRGSRMRQQMIFRRGTRRIDFEGVLEWHEKHRFLKTAFELNIFADECRSEIPFGHIRRTVYRNDPVERAKFEVCQHKWSDLSEGRFGAALLNDCKYGISSGPRGMYLSLCKSGGHPDPSGDEGIHPMNYALIVHDGGFSAGTVVRPAYEFNIPPVVCRGRSRCSGESRAALDADNLIVEAVKIAEHSSDPVLRIYECERAAVTASLRIDGSAVECDMRECELRPLSELKGVSRLSFRPFEIKTVKIKRTCRI